jgi:RNA polymerase sigma-70 factor, ECF subfamily
MKGKLIPLRRVGGEPAEMSDAGLVASCAMGEVAALGALFDRYSGAVYGFLARFAPSRADADDLVQATFLEVQRAAPRFQGKSSVKTWILAIAANIARHHLRDEGRRLAGVSALAERPRAEAGRPDEVAAERELIARIGEAVAALSHDLRVVFVLCDLEGVPGVEAARVLGLRDGTLTRRLCEARKAIRAALGGSWR